MDFVAGVFVITFWVILLLLAFGARRLLIMYLGVIVVYGAIMLAAAVRYGVAAITDGVAIGALALVAVIVFPVAKGVLR